MTLIRIAEALEVSPREFFPESTNESDINVKNEINVNKKVIFFMIKNFI